MGEGGAVESSVLAGSLSDCVLEDDARCSRRVLLSLITLLPLNVKLVGCTLTQLEYLCWLANWRTNVM